jgi:hypothetical protein
MHGVLENHEEVLQLIYSVYLSLILLFHQVVAVQVCDARNDAQRFTAGLKIILETIRV